MKQQEIEILIYWSIGILTGILATLMYQKYF